MLKSLIPNGIVFAYNAYTSSHIYVILIILTILIILIQYKRYVVMYIVTRARLVQVSLFGTSWNRFLVFSMAVN